MAKVKEAAVVAAEPKTIDMPTEAGDKLAVFGTQSTALATGVPEYLRAQIGNHEGNEGVGRDDILVPRLQIAQDGMSPQLKKANEAYIPGLEAGKIFNTVTGDIYGDQVLVVPLIFFKNYIQFKPMASGGGVEKMYNSAADIPAADLQFQGGLPPVVTEFKNRLCLLLQAGKKPELIVASLKSTNIKTAKKWNSLINSTNLPAYARSYTLRVVAKKKGSNDFFGFDVMPEQFVPQEFYAQAKSYFDQMSEGGFKMDTSGLDTEEEEQGGREDGF